MTTLQTSRGFEYGVRHILSPHSGLIFDVLLGILLIDEAELKSLFELGAVYLNHQRWRENTPVQAGDYIRVHTKPRRFPAHNIDWQQRLIFQNEHFVVVNKPAALPVHASVDNLRENVQAYLQRHLGQDLLLTHRLDVPTQGLLVYAKTKEFQSAFNTLIAQRGVRKIYRAQVQGPGPREDRLVHYMEPSPRAPKTVAAEMSAGWQECVLEITDRREVANGITELTIHLITGRTHQIRAQLAFVGFPILGDIAYGASPLYQDERISLAACELSFRDLLSDQDFSFAITPEF